MPLRIVAQLALLWIIAVSVVTTTFIAQENTIRTRDGVAIPTVLQKAEKSKEMLYTYLDSGTSSSTVSGNQSTTTQKTIASTGAQSDQGKVTASTDGIKSTTESAPSTSNSLLKSLFINDETNNQTTPKKVTTLTRYTLSVSPDQLGTVISITSGINCGTTCTVSLEEGSSISLIAYPGQGAVFSGWGGACSGIGICTIVIKKDTLITTTFTQDKVTPVVPPVQPATPQQSTLPSVTGVCGTANGAVFSTMPISELCSTGSASSVSGTGPWTWSCAGSNGGASASCSATLQSSSQFSLSQIAAHITSTDCWIIVNNNVYSVGSYISLHPGGRNAIIGQCGKDATTAFTTRGGTGSHSSNAWSILGTFLIGTVAAPQIPANGVCGSANGSSFASAPSTNLCSVGSIGSFSGSGPWAWSCTGVNGGGSVSCSAQLQGATPPGPLNGVCGSSNGASLSSAPSTNLCSAGSASSVTGAGPWTWSCTGSGTGVTASCSATLSQTPPPASPQTYTVNVTSAGVYDNTTLTLHVGDSINFVYTPPRGSEVRTTFSPAGISSVTIDSEVTQKRRTFNTAGTWTFKAVDKSGNTGTVTVQ